VRIINTARGELIDEQALYDAVESGRVAGAAIDVFSKEPAVGNVLTTSDRIVVTPHLAASTVEAQERAAVSVAEQVLAVLDGRPPRFAANAPLVDPETMAVIGPYIEAAELAARTATQLSPGAVRRVRIEYLGEIANHELSPLRAAVIVGMFGRVSEEKVTIVNADRFAEQHGVRVDEETGPAREPYANLVVVRLFGDDGQIDVAATYTPQGVRVVSIDDYEGVDISPAAASYALAIENVDRPGMIGRIGALLGGWEVNINYMSVAAGRDRRALMVLGTGRPLTERELDEVASIEDIFSARQVDLS
jgi:D-3-phosphoglycerate dehydrogenase